MDVDAWAGTAETISKHLRKGGPILLEGRLKQEAWEGNTTKEERYKLGVARESYSFIGVKK